MGKVMDSKLTKPYPQPLFSYEVEARLCSALNKCMFFKAFYVVGDDFVIMTLFHSF